MLNIYQVPTEEVTKIEWTGDFQEYDRQLSQLGNGHEEFLVINPEFKETVLFKTINNIPPTPGIKCVVWKFNGKWVAKYFNKAWTPEMDYWPININLLWEKNPDISDNIPFLYDPSKLPIQDLFDLSYQLIWYMDPKYNPTNEKVWVMKCTLANFDNLGTKDMGYLSPKVRIKYNPDIKDVKYDFNVVIPWYELNYEHVWYLDERFNLTDERVWAIKVKLLNGAVKPVKDMGYISPKYRLQYNPAIADVKYDFNLSIPWYELNYEHVWYLDERFNPTDERVWAVKFKAINGISNKPVKDMGYISPKYRIKYNPDIPKIDFDFNLSIPWYELNYEHVWYLDERFNPTDERVWAVKFKIANGIPKSMKDMGYVSPKIIYNPDLPALDYVITDHIPYYDLKYEQVWMIDEKLLPSYAEVWAAKIVPHESQGSKVVGNIKCNLPEQLDVVFISYNEPNAEDNWKKVLAKAPNAKRVNGVKGIVAAHKQAADIVTTDMFYVVDGDADLADYWDFKFQPNLFDRDCVHVWRSINPVNDLKYGYGGVKLFPTKLVISADPTNTDMTTSLSDKFKLMPKVSNTTSFNSNEFNAWRSAFRECAKLSGKTVRRQLSRETEKRLDTWCTVGEDRPYGKYAIAGAIAGRQFGKENIGNNNILQLINDFEWIRTKFNEQ